MDIKQFTYYMRIVEQHLDESSAVGETIVNDYVQRYIKIRFGYKNVIILHNLMVIDVDYCSYPTSRIKSEKKEVEEILYNYFLMIKRIKYKYI